MTWEKKPSRQEAEIRFPYWAPVINVTNVHIRRGRADETVGVVQGTRPSRHTHLSPSMMLAADSPQELAVFHFWRLGTDVPCPPVQLLVCKLRPLSCSIVIRRSWHYAALEGGSGHKCGAAKDIWGPSLPTASGATLGAVVCGKCGIPCLSAGGDRHPRKNSKSDRRRYRQGGLPCSSQPEGTAVQVKRGDMVLAPA